jgi:MFS family permease
MNFYPWIVLVHIVGAFLFALSHGVALWMVYQLPREKERSRIAALLDLSQASIGTMYGGFVLLLVGGIWAGIVGNWFSRGWIWAALGVLVAIVVVMYVVAAPYFRNLRIAVGAGSQYARKGETLPQPLPDADVIAIAARSPVAILSAAGFGGLVVILWLMVVKPF